MAVSGVFRNIGKGSLWVLAGLAVSKILFLLSQVIIARSMGASAYGLISIGVTVLAVFSIISRLGLDFGVKRFIPLNRGKYRLIASYSALAVLISSSLMAMILWLFSGHISSALSDSDALEGVLKIFIMAIPVYSTGVILLRSFEGRIIMKYRFWIEALAFGAFLNIAVLLLIPTGSIVKVSYAYLIAYSAILLCGLYVAARRGLLSLKIRLGKLRKEILSYSWPLSLYASLEIMIRYFPIFMLGILATDFEVGVYSAAANIAIMSLVFISVVNPVFFPVIVSLEKKESRKVFENIRKFIFAATLPFLVIAMTLADKILILLFGPEFSGQGVVFAVIILGYFWEILAGPVEMYLSAMDRTKTVMMSMILGIISGIAFGIYLIPLYGIIGAAGSYFGAIFIQKGYCMANIGYRSGEIMNKFIMNTVLLGLLMGLVILLADAFTDHIILIAVIVGLATASYFYWVIRFMMDNSAKEFFRMVKFR